MEKIPPACKWKVGQAVVDLGITHGMYTRASLNKGKTVADTNKVVKITQGLALAVREKLISHRRTEQGDIRSSN
eukprot:5069855-Heterocapsa_arctica.AAC.1